MRQWQSGQAAALLAATVLLFDNALVVQSRLLALDSLLLLFTFASVLLFMLAARSRGLGTAWTTLHLLHEKEAAELLGIPYDEIMQTALVPVAYTRGTDFKRAPRSRSLDQVVHVDGW